MPQLKVDGLGTFNVSADKRLVNALTDDARIDQMHACGGFAKCTTCRVEFISGEPAEMTQAEKDVLASRGLSGQAGLRLSCQLLCSHDMSLRAPSRVSTTGAKDAGKKPEPQITPPPVWVKR